AATRPVAGEGDDRAHARSDVHPLAVVSRAEPGQREREQTRMSGRRLEPHTVPAVDRRVLVGHHRLWRTLPALHCLRVATGDGAGWVQVQVAAERWMPDARAEEQGRRLQTASRNDHEARAHVDVELRAHRRRRIPRDGMNAGYACPRARQLLHAAIRDDGNVTVALRVGQESRSRALLAAVPATEHTVAALLLVAAARVSRCELPAPSERLTTSPKRIVVAVHLTLVRPHRAPLAHRVERMGEAFLREEPKSGLSGPLIAHVVGKAKRCLPVHGRATAET